jgi:nucleoside-diphosphate-sugar epimerase
MGSVLTRQLLSSGHKVRVLDSLMYGSDSLAELAGHKDFELIQGDIRDRRTVQRALRDVDAVVHLAAIVGDPACARDQATATAVNLDASLALIADAEKAGVRSFVFASTCSNYGRQEDTSVLATEDHDLRPVSLYAQTKVNVERDLLGGKERTLNATVLRFSTLYGLSPRMRFDLTVNEFVRELMTSRELTVYGEQFWRPYVHVTDAARAIAAVLEAAPALVRGRVFNVGDTAENYRKLDLVKIVRERVGGGEVKFVQRTEDPRDYRVSCDAIRTALGYVVTRRVPDGVDEIAGAIEAGQYVDRTATYGNVA